MTGPQPADAFYVGRPTQWGNPYRVGAPRPGGVGVVTPGIAVAKYRDLLDYGTDVSRALIVNNLSQLRGHDLAYWCPLADAQGNPMPCHADVLLELANREGSR